MGNPFDPFDIASSLMRVGINWLNRPKELHHRITELNRSLLETGLAELETVLRAWSDNGDSPEKTMMTYVKKNASAARKLHAIAGEWLKEMAASSPGSAETDLKRARFWMNQAVSMTTPSNCFGLNPGAVQRFVKSDGESLQRGVKHFIEDIRRNGGLIRLVDESAFVIGENLATSEGEVVFRNDLLELIQYRPVNDAVYPVPIVLIQPWINKYYIFDLSPHNSFVKFLLQEGFTVFITSWKNPTPEMADVSFEDYMIRGALQSVEAARDICGVEAVHAAGYCIGGTILAALMAYLNHKEASVPVIDWTLFATLVDFSEPGELGVFVSESILNALKPLVESAGYLDAKYLGLTFRLLNPDSLIWRYYTNNYLFGENPPKSDMLFWNSDSTRLPMSMFMYYIKELYIHNRLVQSNGLELGGYPIDLKKIRQPLYIVGAVQDHICPWESTFKICSLLNCSVRYVLTSEGHITGIVNPPSPRSKKKYYAGPAEKETDPQDWLARQSEQTNSWWPDWVEFLKSRSGEKTYPPPIGSAKYPPMMKSPGRYVLER